MRSDNRAWGSAAAAAVLVVLVACGDGGVERRTAPGPAPDHAPASLLTTDTVADTTSTSEAAPTTTTAPEAEVKVKKVAADADGGGGSADVRAVQLRLAELGYDVGVADGGFGDRTSHAVMSFQKVEGLDRTGRINAATTEALASASRPGPMVPGGASTRVEINLDKQVLFFWQGGSLARILNASSGNGERYCVDGECDVAVTRPGTFRIGRKYNGMEVSRLGELYHPMYFDGGIAIHGSPSVPGHPASHGCIRIPMYSSGSFHTQVPGGTMVYVIGTPAGDVPAAPPPDEPIVQDPEPEPPPPEPSPTTTEAPATTTTTEPPTTTTTSPGTTSTTAAA